MTKHDWIWVAIKVFGIYLLVLAVIAIPSLIGSIIGLCTAHSFGHSGATDIDRFSETIYAGIRREFVDALARLLIFGAIGTYFVRGASWAFKILCHQI